MFITTSRKINEKIVTEAIRVSEELNIKYVPRNKSSINELKKQQLSKEAIILYKDKLLIDTEGGDLFFHPNMAQVRIKRLRAGGNDNMLDAMKIEEGMSVLDCTLGFGADAIVSAYKVGDKGKVIGLESNPYIAYLVKTGLKTYKASNLLLENTFKRIDVLNFNYKDYLVTLADNSFDVIYFDPMFSHPRMNSENLLPLRSLANMEELKKDTLKEAIRVAKYRVVLKDNYFSSKFNELGFNILVGGKYSPIKYGVIETKKV